MNTTEPTQETETKGDTQAIATTAMLASLQWLDAVAKELGADCSTIQYAGIVDTPSGGNEHESTELYDELWIDQRSGPCGDDYYGEMYARKGTIWVSFVFSC